ncbi:hypothetical protein MHU86_3535 [Fragilaria crotonensis]|nr:hypothetical protein MHU86_3535 [Fragilaria crotonensis]
MTTTIAELRSTLERLQAYELPESLQTTSDVTVDGHNFEERYGTARDEYLQKRFQQVFYEHLTSFDGHSVPLPDVPSEEECLELQEQHKAAQIELKATAARVYEKHQELQSKYDMFVSRREEIARMIADMDESVTDSDDEDKENDDGNDDDVMEQELVAKEQKCLALAQRKNELLRQIARREADLMSQEKNLAETTHRLAELRKANPNIPDVTQDTLADIEAGTDEVERGVRKYEEITEWNDGTRCMIEKLTGITILSVTNAEDGKAIILVVQLLGVHELEFRLEPDPRRQSNLRIQSAKFLTSTIVRGASVDNTSQVELRIPEVSDLVRLCSTMGPAEDLRFVLREAVARIDAMVARAHELTTLRQKYLTKIGALHHSGHSFGGEDQEIVCSINEGVTVVLRLTPDCPIGDGSAYLDQIVGVGGWDQGILEGLRGA